MLGNRPLALLVVVATVACAGCSRSGLVVGAMLPILENSKTVALASNDMRTFVDATPSNLFLLEALIQTKPEKRELREQAALLYFAYGFTFDAPEDQWYAEVLYQKGLAHGKRALQMNKKFGDAWNKPFDAFSASVRKLGDKDLPLIVWTVANWSQFVSLHLDSTDVLLDIPKLQVLLERAIEIDGEYFEGLPYMIHGSLLAFRPPLMGGDPEGSKASFDRAFAISDGKFLLASYFYAKFYCYRIQDADMFQATLEHVIAQPDTLMPEYRLLNRLAINKSAHLLQEKDDLF
jgi:hypothetical protein